MATAASLHRDLTINGIGLGVVGVAGLVGAIATSGGEVARVAVPWVIVIVVLGLAQVVVSSGWLRSTVADAPAVPDGLAIEDPGAQLRRAGLPTVIAAVLVLVGLLIAPPLGALAAGLAAGAAATDLRTRHWLGQVQRERDVVIMREVAALPFATTRKPLWEQPD